MPRSTISWIAVSALLACVACGGAPPRDPHQQPTFPARGQVLLDGKPVRNAVVTFCPVDGSSAKAARGYARTDSDGKFELSTYQPGDGVPVGRYWVAILQDADENGMRVPGRYANPKTSGLTVEVKERDNTLPVIRVGRRPELDPTRPQQFGIGQQKGT